MKRVLAVLLCMLLLTSCGRTPRYEMRQDLGIWFTNADEIVETMSSAFRDAPLSRACRLPFPIKL